MAEENDLIFKILAVVSPVVSGALTYFLSQRSKKVEYLYQHRIPAFKEVFKSLVTIKNFAIGEVALQRGSEFSPFFDELGSPLELRTILAKSRQENDIFLTKKSRESLNEVDASLGIFCNAVVGQKNTDGSDEYDIDYQPLLDLVNKAQEIMYNDMDLPN